MQRARRALPDHHQRHEGKGRGGQVSPRHCPGKRTAGGSCTGLGRPRDAAPSLPASLHPASRCYLAAGAAFSEPVIFFFFPLYVFFPPLPSAPFRYYFIFGAAGTQNEGSEAGASPGWGWEGTEGLPMSAVVREPQLGDAPKLAVAPLPLGVLCGVIF